MARMTKRNEVENEKEIKDTENVVNEKSTSNETKEEEKQEPIETKPREVAQPVVVASYRIPERKKINHFVLYIAIVCFLLFISTIVLSILQYKTSKKVNNVLQKNVDMELNYLQLSEKYDELKEKYDELSEQYEGILENFIEEDLMEVKE